ncbi:phosphoribosylformylglycinamidine cyclo-ligase [candidate division KSB1 bacterium]|nr:phosphoribosylformylglycinamidine cyclo-ligase [candidate division KSB1 bacterium]MBL7093190.1 phosphoribosylformylglycinamidine cyclo-ligase [candidate division KSB1 bacterium]
MTKSISYKDAGVDIAAGEKSVKEIARLAKSTFTKNVIRDVGLFGSFFQLDTSEMNNPILVSSVDGVGTKLKIAFLSNVHDTIGEDLVNHCVNDIMTSGADPLFFLDYIALSKLNPEVLVKIIEGLARGCKNANCALVGGETAEMPNFYQASEYDISGTIVGIIEKNKIVDGSKIKTGDILLALPSNGLHTNGYSLVRKIFFEINNFKVEDYFEELGCTLADELLRVHSSYQHAINLLKHKAYLHGMSHITGGGIEGNTYRILPDNLKLKIDWKSWEPLEIFQVIQGIGNVTSEEMRKVFNLGVGFVFIIDNKFIDETKDTLKKKNIHSFIIGEVN